MNREVGDMHSKQEEELKGQEVGGEMEVRLWTYTFLKHKHLEQNKCPMSEFMY